MPHGVVAIIPARFASTRFPGKPLVSIKGISLLERTYRQVIKCPEITRVIIATDDERILDCAQKFHAETVLTSSSCPTGTDRIAEVIKKDSCLLEARAIVNVQGDEPCIDPENISKVIDTLLVSTTASIGTLVSPIACESDLRNRNIVKCVKTLSGKALYFSRHAIPGSKKEGELCSGFCYFRHIGLYAYRPPFVLTFASLSPTPLQQAEDLEMLRALEHGYEIHVAEVNHHSPDVNTPEDIEEVIQWIEHQSTCS